MKTIISGFVLYFCIFVSGCADTPKEIFIQIDLDIENEFYQSVKQHYGTFELGYIKGDLEYENYGHFFTVERINYYYQKDNIRYFLGYVDKDGIYDKNSALIKKCPFVNTDKSVNIGLSSHMLRHPFGPMIAIKAGGAVRNANQYGLIRIDFSQNTLIFQSITY
ncbi:MAG: hypothetical protein Ta2A_08940 [Treponemataceae bacterium]|nr:MAG: hypothetical protein Ta2A_08940 [Treponemataceae bacterium]